MLSRNLNGLDCICMFSNLQIAIHSLELRHEKSMFMPYANKKKRKSVCASEQNAKSTEETH